MQSQFRRRISVRHWVSKRQSLSRLLPGNGNEVNSRFQVGHESCERLEGARSSRRSSHRVRSAFDVTVPKKRTIAKPPSFSRSGLAREMREPVSHRTNADIKTGNSNPLCRSLSLPEWADKGHPRRNNRRSNRPEGVSAPRHNVGNRKNTGTRRLASFLSRCRRIVDMLELIRVQHLPASTYRLCETIGLRRAIRRRQVPDGNNND